MIFLPDGLQVNDHEASSLCRMSQDSLVDRTKSSSGPVQGADANHDVGQIVSVVRCNSLRRNYMALGLQERVACQVYQLKSNLEYEETTYFHRSVELTKMNLRQYTHCICFNGSSKVLVGSLGIRGFSASEIDVPWLVWVL